jgi:hypothetical protein
MSRVFVLPALFALAFLPGAVHAGPTEVPKDAVKVAADQFYGPWEKSKNYSFRSYYFKVSPEDKTFQEHVVLYYNKQPHVFYYYNPETQKFWGRGSFDCHGKELYQFLEPGERKGELKDINFNSKPIEAPPKLGAVADPPPAGGATPPAAGGTTPPPAGGATPPPDVKPGTPPAATPPAGGDKVAAAGPRLKLPPDEPPPENVFGG